MRQNFTTAAVATRQVCRFYFESPRPDSSEYSRRNMRHSQTSAASSSSSLAWLSLLVLIASSREFSRTCSCHAFGLSRPSLLPSWALRSGTEINVMTRAEPEVSWANVLERNGSNEDDKQLPVQQQQPPPQEQDASSKLPSSLPSSPPLTFEKYLTMSNKRVPVEIRYDSQQSGLRPFFLTVAKKVKDKYPDVVVQKTDLASLSSSGGGGEAAPGDVVFEVLVDGKGVVGKAQTKKQSIENGGGGGGSSGVGSPVDLANGISIYVSMGEIDQAIAKARRKRRPSTTYSQQGEDRESEGVSAIRLEVLRLRQQQRQKQKAEGRQ